MSQADSNSSITAPAVSTRRRFLSQAAGVAAGGTVLALAAIPPARAATAPVGVLGPIDPSNASPALRSAIATLNEAFDRFEAAAEVFGVKWRQVRDWEERNRMPLPRRTYRKWENRSQKFNEAIGFYPAMDEKEAARKEFQAAQLAVANFKPLVDYDLTMKAAAAVLYDLVKAHHGEAIPVISYSVASYLVQQRMPAVTS